MAFTSDRKVLLQRVDKLRLENEQLKTNSDLKRIKEQMARDEAEREKILSEHGSIVGEIQQRYTKERIHSEKMEKQVTELSKRLQEKDEQLQRKETRLKEATKMEQELQYWKKKAEMTPSAQVLKGELENLKAFYENEFATLRNRHAINFGISDEKDSRIMDLENKVKELTSECAVVEREKFKLGDLVEEMQNKLNIFTREKEKMVKKTLSETIQQQQQPTKNNPVNKERPKSSPELIKIIQENYRLLQKSSIEAIDIFSKFQFQK